MSQSSSFLTPQHIQCWDLSILLNMFFSLDAYDTQSLLLLLLSEPTFLPLSLYDSLTLKQPLSVRVPQDLVLGLPGTPCPFCTLSLSDHTQTQELSYHLCAHYGSSPTPTSLLSSRPRTPATWHCLVAFSKASQNSIY